MATVIRSEVSKNSKYYVEKHRYYELKHFCLQYLNWKKEYSSIELISSSSLKPIVVRSNIPGDPTSRLAEDRTLYFDKMQLVEQTVLATDADLYQYLLKGITEEVSYTYLKSKLGIPCGRDTYYNAYRRFFWLLDKAKF